jgi:ornithine decarboxylase
MHTLDVGGGFSSESFEAMASVLSQALDDYFPPNIRVIGEPGRYYVASAFTLACHVIARRTVADPTLGTTSYMLYMNDGVYGNFSSIMFDHQNPIPKILRCGNQVMYGGNEQRGGYDSPNVVEYSIWGPTCDGIDCIAQSATFRETLDIGDWLYFEEMGGKSIFHSNAFTRLFTNLPQLIQSALLPSSMGSQTSMMLFMSVVTLALVLFWV